MHHTHMHVHAHTHTHTLPSMFLKYLLRYAVFAEMKHRCRTWEKSGHPPPCCPLPLQLLCAPTVYIEHPRNGEFQLMKILTN